jgi:hypothetical protein
MLIPNILERTPRELKFFWLEDNATNIVLSSSYKNFLNFNSIIKGVTVGF